MGIHNEYGKLPLKFKVYGVGIGNLVQTQSVMYYLFIFLLAYLSIYDLSFNMFKCKININLTLIRTFYEFS